MGEHGRPQLFPIVTGPAACCLPGAMSSLLSSLIPAAFVLIWASGFVAARYVAPYAEPLAFVAVRLALVALVLAGLAFALRARWPRTGAAWRDGMIAGVLMQGIYVAGVFWSVHRGLPAGIAALVGSLQPLLTAAVSQPLLGERVGPRRWAGIGLGFLGAGLVLGPKLGAVDAAGIPPIALLVSLAAMLAMTAGTLWQKRKAVSVDLRTNAAAQFVGALLFTLPLALLTETGQFDLSTPLLLGLTWAVLGLSVGGILILLGLIRRGAVAGIAALFYLVPPVSAAMAFGLFGETLAPVQLLGMVVAVLGVAIASRG